MSPLALAQERVPRGEHYPWRVIVVCALLNLTNGAQVRPVLDELFRRCPTPADMLVRDLGDLLRPLGLQTRRAYLLRLMTLDYVCGVPAAECHGVGQYARDALALFVDGRTDVDPDDHWLRPYLDWRLRGGPALEWKQPDRRAAQKVTK